MAFRLFDRTRDTTVTNGTGSITVSGTPPITYQALNQRLVVNDIFYYAIVHQTKNEWEVGIGTLTAGTTFSRSAGNVLDGSGGAGALVNFSAGTKDVWVDHPALGVVYADDNDYVTLPVGTANQPIIALQSLFQVNSLGVNSAWALSIARWTADANGPNIVYAKSRGATVGANTIVQNGDSLGNIYWYGADGSDFSAAAQIVCSVDGTPGVGDMPGRITFYTTPDGSATPLSRMWINNSGVIAMGADSTPGNITLEVLNNSGAGQIRIRYDGSGAGCLFNQATSGGEVSINNQANARFVYATNNAYAMSLDASGHVQISDQVFTITSWSVGGNANALQIYGATAPAGGSTLAMFNATAATCAHFDFYRSKNAATGSATVVASGDALGSINWYGAQQTGTIATQNIAGQIICEVDAAVTSGAGADMPGRLRFLTTPDGSGTPAEAMRIDALQCVTIGGTVGNVLTAFGVNSQLEVNSLANVSASFIRWSSGTGSGPDWVLAKSRSGTIGTHTIVQSGDALGNIDFAGSNGSSFDVAAQISGLVDGTPGASNDMPGRLVFLTAADGTATLTERMRINNAGAVFFPSVGTTAGGGSGARLDNATTPANSLLRDTSSLRYKTDLSDVPPERLFAALDMLPIEFRSKASADDQSMRYVGLGAETVAGIDPTLVAWGREYEGGPLLPDGVQYDRVNLLRTEALKLRCAVLEAKIAELERRL